MGKGKNKSKNRELFRFEGGRVTFNKMSPMKGFLARSTR